MIRRLVDITVAWIVVSIALMTIVLIFDGSVELGDSIFAILLAPIAALLYVPLYTIFAIVEGDWLLLMKGATFLGIWLAVFYILTMVRGLFRALPEVK